MEAVITLTADTPMYVWCAKGRTPSHIFRGAEEKVTRWNPGATVNQDILECMVTTGNSLFDYCISDYRLGIVP